MVDGINFLIFLFNTSLLVYRNIAHLYVNFYPAGLLNPFIYCDSSLVAYLGYYYVICKPWHLYFFLSNLDSFISLSWLSVVARTSNTMKVWTKLARVGTLVFEELLSVFIIEYYISCRLIVRGFYYVELCSIYSHIVESFFNHKWTSNFVKCFFFIEMIIWFLFFCLLMWRNND